MSLGAGAVRKGLINQVSLEAFSLIWDLQECGVGSVGVCDSLQSLSTATGDKGVKWGWKEPGCDWGGWDQAKSGTGVPKFGRSHCLTYSLNGHHSLMIRRGLVSAVMSSTTSHWPHLAICYSSDSFVIWVLYHQLHVLGGDLNWCYSDPLFFLTDLSGKQSADWCQTGLLVICLIPKQYVESFCYLWN